jgi:chemotaxis protein CheD
MKPVVGQLRAAKGAELDLLAGQLYFGHEAALARTLLGSCVAITLWHRRRRVGGMCHYLLPERCHPAAGPLDGRFGNEAVEILVRALLQADTHPADYEAHLYGGADTLSVRTGVRLNIGQRNIEQGWTLIEHYGFQLVGVDVGDHVPRHVSLNLRTGEVNMRRGHPHPSRLQEPA